MGRFRVHDILDSNDEDEQDDGEYHHHHNIAQQWEFVGDPGEEGAMVVRSAETDERTTPQESPTTASATERLDRQPQQERNNTCYWESAVPYDTDVLWNDEAVEEWSFKKKKKHHRRGYRLFWLMSLTIAVIAWCWKDPPPAPPPPQAAFGKDDDDDVIRSSWNDYLMRHTSSLLESATALGVHTPWHIGTWLAASIRADVELCYQDYRRQQKQTQCGILPPQVLSERYIKKLQNEKEHAAMVVGQELAVERLSEALQVWSSRSSSSTTTKNTKNGPLVLWAVGYPHTGKRTLLLELAKAAATRRLSLSSKCPDAVLELVGKDWNSATTNQPTNDNQKGDILVTVEDLYRKLVSRIQSHLESGGSMILLDGAEDMDPQLLNMFLKSMSKDDDTAENSDDDDDRLLWNLCRNTIVYVTSESTTFGLTPIARSLRATGGNLMDAGSSLSADLWDALHQQLGGSSAASAIHTILPFAPLTPDSLEQLLRLKLQRYSASLAAEGAWKRFVVTDAALKTLLYERRVEYLEWRSRSSANDVNNNAPPQHVMTVAMEGAKVLADKGAIMTKIYAQVSQLLTTTDAPQPHRVAVLDYKDNNDNVDTKPGGVLKWCDEASNDGMLIHCQEVLRFRI